ncbi:Cell division protein FtsW [hydrothermal vent metagenome]|uniref:peptidoglycan glycosyltransferase n=1 Tax=hydrothermal vent metagenome TaxID=652676 RepID=A0A3B1BCB3_9ZZZZ
MTVQAIRQAGVSARADHQDSILLSLDPWLLLPAVSLLMLGLVMVGSASISIAEQQTGQPFYFLIRQSVYVGLGLGLAWGVWHLPMRLWQVAGPYLIIASVLMLSLLFIPGLGREVNGSLRWMALGPVNLQVSEVVKLFVVIYLAGYLLRHNEAVRNEAGGFLRPLALMVLLSMLLLLEPDFGAVGVMMATAMGMMWLGGARLLQFLLLGMGMLGMLGMLAVAAPYRMARLTTFLNPWADPYNSGFQLTQALIAFGRGEWLGVGLGSSVQKLFYLPEAHTDFLFAVMAEELGLVAVVLVITLFLVIVLRALYIGQRAEKQEHLFMAYVAYGLGIWIGLQAFINIGVNMGVLPTKGLTLPLMSYGGSSMMVMCIAMALLLRIEYETRVGTMRHEAKRHKPVVKTSLHGRTGHV